MHGRMLDGGRRCALADVEQTRTCGVFLERRFVVVRTKQRIAHALPPPCKSSQRMSLHALRQPALQPQLRLARRPPRRRVAASCRCAGARSSLRVRAGMTLFTHPASRGKIVEWCVRGCAHAAPAPGSLSLPRRYIEELGGADALGIRIVQVDMLAGEHKTAEFLRARRHQRVVSASPVSSARLTRCPAPTPPRTGQSLRQAARAERRRLTFGARCARLPS